MLVIYSNVYPFEITLLSYAKIVAGVKLNMPRFVNREPHNFNLTFTTFGF